MYLSYIYVYIVPTNITKHLLVYQFNPGKYVRNGTCEIASSTCDFLLNLVLVNSMLTLMLFLVPLWAKRYHQHQLPALRRLLLSVDALSTTNVHIFLFIINFTF
jgi:hypothetical protein